MAAVMSSTICMSAVGSRAMAASTWELFGQLARYEAYWGEEHSHRAAKLPVGGNHNPPEFTLDIATYVSTGIGAGVGLVIEFGVEDSRVGACATANRFVRRGFNEFERMVTVATLLASRRGSRRRRRRPRHRARDVGGGNGVAADGVGRRCVDILLPAAFRPDALSLRTLALRTPAPREEIFTGGLGHIHDRFCAHFVRTIDQQCHPLRATGIIESPRVGVVAELLQAPKFVLGYLLRHSQQRAIERSGS